MKQTIKATCIIVATIFAQFFLESYSFADSACKEFNIACNVPLTGPLATYGAAIQEGVSFAQENLSPTQIPIKYHWEDNQSTGKLAVSVLRKQLLQNPDLYVSGVKPQYMAVKEHILKTGIPHFVWVFDVNVRPDNQNNFRTWVNFKAEAPLFIDYARKLKPKKIAVVYVQLPSTDEQYQKIVIPGLKNAGFSDLRIEPYQMDKIDFKDLALSLREYNPDLFILSGFQENFVSMIKAFNNLKLIRDGNTVATYDLVDAAPLLNASETEGIRVSSPSFLLDHENVRISDWTKRFEAKFHKKPLYTHAYAFDMADIISSASEKLQTACAGQELTRALNQVDKQGITGRLKFDEYGDLLPSVKLGVFRNKKLVSD